MKKHMSKLLKITMCILIAMNFSGCWNRRELDTLGIVMGVGVDKSIEPGKIKITAQIVKPGGIKQQSKGSTGETGAFWNVTGTGRTVFSTLRDITSKSSRKLFFPHNQILIFDKKIAEEGMQKYIDFFMRDPETRVDVLVLISENSAQDILNSITELEKVPASNIVKLVKGNAAATSQTMAVTLRDIIPGFMSKTAGSIVPFIKISNDGSNIVPMISGNAVLKGDKLVGEMDKKEGRGLMWVLGKVKSGIIEVEDSNNDLVSIEIIDASSKIVPEIKNNNIIMRVNINEEGNISEETGSLNLGKLPQVASLENKINEAIKNEVMAAVKKAQELDTDVFGFGEAVHKKYPKQWKKLKNTWDEEFQNVQVEVHVEGKLRLMGRISKPSVPEKEKK